jgi:hypothetical protein
MDMDETKAIASGDGLNHLLERLLDEVEAPPAEDSPSSVSPPPPTEDTAVVGHRAGTEEGGSPLAALLSNPALMSALPMLIENVGPLMGSLTGGRGSGGAPSSTRPHAVDRHTAPLCAIKPYLSPQRREAAETVIRLCRVWDALERSGISLSGLLAGLPAGIDESRRDESGRGERR